MFVVASASTGSALACAPVPGAPSSRGVVASVVSGSRRNGRPFVSLRNLEIRRVRRTGSRRRVGGIVLFDAAGEPGPPRVAVTAGRGVGKAVVRNRAKRRMREAIRDVTFCLMIATTLHSIAVGNLLPAWVKVVCVDINPSTVIKLSDRGSFQTIGLVTDVEPFLRALVQEVEKIGGG